MSAAGAVGSLIQGFFVDHLRRHKQVSPQTVTAYRDTFRLLLGFLQATRGIAPASVRLADLDVSLILAFLDHLEQQRQNAVCTRNARLAAVRSFFRYVVLREPDALDLATRVLAIPNKRTNRRLVGYFTRPEMDALLAAPDRTTHAGRRDHALLLTMYSSGARVSEIATLRRAQVCLGTSPSIQLHGKGRIERAVPLWPRTARVLRGWFAEPGDRADGVAFPDARGGPLTRHGVIYLLNQAVQRARSMCPSLTGKPASPHVIRHTTAMHLLQAGVDPATIALWLGHERLETTHMYVEADLAMKEQALGKLRPLGPGSQRFKADDALLSLLATL
jgi:site-specific recombinase XerD